MNNEEANPTETPNRNPPYANLFSNPQAQTPDQTSNEEDQSSPQVPQPKREPEPKTQTQPEQQSSEQPTAPVQKQNLAPLIAEPPGLTEEQKKQHHLVMLEAALYVAGRPLDLNEICAVINSRSKKRGQQLVKELIAEYSSRSSALEILELRDERYVLQLKAEYTPLVKKFVNRPLLSAGPLKTLSYIAYRQPISQKRVIEVRGQHAYGHVKMLSEMDLIASERNGRSIMLRTTDYFADYFGLAQDTTAMKRDLKRIFGDFPAKVEKQTDAQQQAKDEQQL